VERDPLSRLIVISNRVAAPKPEGEGGAQGGLAVALSAALREYRGLWFGWSGNKVDEFTGHIDFQRHDGVTSATIDLEEQDVDEYYNGYANRTLWPLFHYRIDLAEYDRSFAGGYERVNERFAETVRPLIEPDDLIWVHDYHLIPLGAQLRERGLKNRMGFFLHIPFPPSRLMVSLPFHEGLVLSLLAYDVIGFQTEEWLESFQNYVERELGGHCDPDGTIHVGGRSVHAAATRSASTTRNSGGGDSEGARSPSTAQEERRRPPHHHRRRPARLFQGLEERFLGYRRFSRRMRMPRQGLHAPDRAAVARRGPYLRDDPRKPRRAVRPDQRRVRGSGLGADPLRQPGLWPRGPAGFYRAAEIGLITPLRDGMNLVAKEYVAPRTRRIPASSSCPASPARRCSCKDALLVNPYSKEESRRDPSGYQDAKGRAYPPAGRQ
jgi:trehalose 6-phosphate synthase